MTCLIDPGTCTPTRLVFRGLDGRERLARLLEPWSLPSEKRKIIPIVDPMVQDYLANHSPARCRWQRRCTCDVGSPNEEQTK